MSVCLLAYYDSGNLDDLGGPVLLEGIRVPELWAGLWVYEPDRGHEFPFELRVLRAQLLAPPDGAEATELGLLEMLAANDSDRSEALQVYSDWPNERGMGPAGRVIFKRALRRSMAVDVSVLQNAIRWKGTLRGHPPKARAALEVMMKDYPPTSLVDKSTVQVSDHMAQACMCSDEWHEGQPMFHQWSSSMTYGVEPTPSLRRTSFASPVVGTCFPRTTTKLKAYVVIRAGAWPSVGTFG